MLFFLITVLHISCKKEITEGPGEVYGNWILTAKQFDSHDGSGGEILRVVSNLTIKFTESGIIEGTAYPHFKSFKIIDENKMEIYFDYTTSKPAVYFYRVTDKSLSLGNQVCVEGCYQRFKRH